MIAVYTFDVDSSCLVLCRVYKLRAREHLEDHFHLYQSGQGNIVNRSVISMFTS